MNPNWKAELKANMLAYMAKAKREGTVAMGDLCLAQCVRIPQGGPIGTNARWAFMQTFNEIVRETPALSRFVYDQRAAV